MYVYLLTNPAHTVLYTCVTNDLERRLHEHSQGLGVASRFTGKYQCNLLVYFEALPDARQAIVREKEIKGWSRRKKEDLVAMLNPEWRPIDLTCWDGDTTNGN
jgi:putative endonuclease